jgi:hypothetical protein
MNWYPDSMQRLRAIWTDAAAPRSAQCGYPVEADRVAQTSAKVTQFNQILAGALNFDEVGQLCGGIIGFISNDDIIGNNY